jgi:hypothetical protein
VRAPGRWYQLRERGLFDGEERSHFASARAEHTDEGNDHQCNDIVRGRKCHTAGRHEERARDQHAPATDAVRRRRDVERNYGVADHGEREQESDFFF